jgi:hypothetical protein
MRSSRPGDDDALQQAQTQAQRDIQALRSRVPPAPAGHNEHPWLARADVRAAFGFAFGEAQLFDQAARWLTEALAAAGGDCPVRAAEQAANFRVRAAAMHWQTLQREAGRQGPTAGQRAALVAQITAARDDLRLLCHLGSTAERLALLGGASKRLAWVSVGEDRLQALKEMAGYYQQAASAHSPPSGYHFCNEAIAQLLLQGLDTRRARSAPLVQALRSQCDAVEAATRQAMARQPDIWLATGLGDLQLTRLLLEAPEDHEAAAAWAAAAVDRYADALARGASLREQASQREHLDFLITLTADQGPAKTRRRTPSWPPAVRQALVTVRQAL